MLLGPCVFWLTESSFRPCNRPRPKGSFDNARYKLARGGEKHNNKSFFVLFCFVLFLFLFCFVLFCFVSVPHEPPLSSPTADVSGSSLRHFRISSAEGEACSAFPRVMIRCMSGAAGASLEDADDDVPWLDSSAPLRRVTHMSTTAPGCIT